MPASKSGIRTLVDKLTLRPSSDQHTRYRHTALDTSGRHIRLVKVDPRHKADHFSVEVFPLEEAPPFIALSYTWGPPTPTRIIFIGKRRLEVRSNLHDFLRVFAKRHRSDFLWVDQVSIDQESHGERNHQVQFMEEIYRQASEVVIWLGKQTYSSRSPPGKIIENHQQYTRNRHRRIMVRFFTNPYWRRLWVLQEIFNARHIKIYYGSSELPWYLIQKIVALRVPSRVLRIPNHVRWLAENSRSEQSVSSIRVSGATPFNAWVIFELHNCQVPRDIYYALQGLFEPKWRLVVYYTKAVDEIFAEAATMILFSSSQAFSAKSRGPRGCIEACWRLAWRIEVATLENRGFALAIGYAVLSWWLYKHHEQLLQENEDTAACTESLKGAILDACRCENVPTEDWLRKRDREFEAGAGSRSLSIRGFPLGMSASRWLQMVLND